MFETMQSFLAFFFPTLALIILGILFEEKLIAFEQWLFARLFGNGKRAAARRSQQSAPVLRKVEHKPARAPHQHTNRAA